MSNGNDKRRSWWARPLDLPWWVWLSVAVLVALAALLMYSDAASWH
jgi:hypothetical protein